MSHLPDRRDMYRRVAAQADKILNPGHIPVALLDHFIRADEDRPRDRDPQWANGPSARCDVLLLISHIILTHSNDTYALFHASGGGCQEICNTRHSGPGPADHRGMTKKQATTNGIS